MIITDEELIKRGFKKFNTEGRFNEAKKYLFQKRYINDKGDTLYFMDINKYDWTIFPLNVIPDAYTYEITTQLYRKGDHEPINIQFGTFTTIDEAEQFINKLFDVGLVEVYESAGE